MPRKFEGKIVLVTGASRGIGKDIALAFAREGASLVLAARSAEGLQRVEQEIGEMGCEALSIPTDVSSQASVNSLVAEAQNHFGRIDVLVNNAGIGRVGSIDSEAFEEDLQQTLQASLFGMIHVTRRVLPIFRQQGSGTIVNMSSVVGRKAFPRFGAYAIAMHGVSAFSDSLRQECAGTNIQVSVIHPALTATDLLRGRRIANASAVPPHDPAFVRLCREGSCQSSLSEATPSGLASSREYAAARRRLVTQAWRRDRQLSHHPAYCLASRA
jgi:NAD(P)-dependent dehydrogenase (short-subunit alcohol dehydrogenase family)